MKILPFLMVLLFSCTKEVKYTKEQLLAMAVKADPTVSFIIPRNMNEGIQCSSYTEGCVSGHMVKLKGFEMIAVEFMTEEQARRAAVKYRGYYLRNWLLDDVTGEPILEKFVTEELQAKKPEEDPLKKP